MGILASIALPYLQRTFLNLQLLTHQYALHHHLKSARYALSHYQTVVVCPSNTPTHCETTWPASGYRIFGTSSTGEPIEIQTIRLPRFIQAHFEGFGQEKWLIFSEGKLLSTNGTFSLCTHNTCKHIIINKAGRVKLAKNNH